MPAPRWPEYAGAAAAPVGPAVAGLCRSVTTASAAHFWLRRSPRTPAFLFHSWAMDLQFQQKLPSLRPLLAIDAQSPTGRWRPAQTQPANRQDQAPWSNDRMTCRQRAANALQRQQKSGRSRFAAVQGPKAPTPVFRPCDDDGPGSPARPARPASWRRFQVPARRSR